MGLAIRLLERLGFAEGIQIGSRADEKPASTEVAVICRPCGRILGTAGKHEIVECHPGPPVARSRWSDVRLGSAEIAIGFVDLGGGR